jgi:guanylate kinase
MIIVVSGPGGVGKGTLVTEAVARDEGLWLNRSWTTRARRPDEPEGAYVFVSRQAFEDRIAGGGFLEWAEFLGELYGSPIPEAPPGQDVVLEIDVQGARQIRDLDPDALLVFVDAPSPEAQAARLRGRGDPEEAVAARLRAAEAERREARELGMVTLVNDDLERAVAEFDRLVAAHRRR